MDKSEKVDMFDGIVEDQKQKFRMTQIEEEGNDPAESGEKVEDEEGDASQNGKWGGSEKEFGNEDRDYGNARSKDVKDATKYQKERYGKRDFKHGSPLHPGKGATAMAAEGLMQQLRKRFGKNIDKQSILSEKVILDEETVE